MQKFLITIYSIIYYLRIMTLPNYFDVLFFSCIRGLLKDKITIIATQQIQYLEHAANIVYLQNVSFHLVYVHKNMHN